VFDREMVRHATTAFIFSVSNRALAASPQL
jgi:hypothetical protein